MVKPVTLVLILLPVTALCASRGSECYTPNNEQSICTALSNCKILYDALFNSRNPDVVAFAKESQCGYDVEPLVCCGSTISKKLEGRGSVCVTPNQESAICQPLNNCPIIKDSLATGGKSAADFAKQSQCGYDTEPLVCCGLQDYTYLNNISPLLPARSLCGIEKDENRVYGGEITEIGEFPWMALLRYKFTDGEDAGFKCGGSLINNRYVLTAAHCLIINTNAGFEVDSVRLGEWRISTVKDCEQQTPNEECSDPVIDLKIQSKIVHPSYHRRSGKNDIALIRLERNVAYTNYVRAICLPFSEAVSPEPGTLLHIAGWGATENSSASDYKLKVRVPLVSNEECGNKIKRRGPITEEQVCAGGVTGKDSCQGDSGGPLMKLIRINKERNQWYQEGIVSWGVSCGITGFPGVYIRVSKYTDWIINNLSTF